ncbi:sensor domain-containing diguanylate cyclase, partial [Vibrio makurazakiensis]|uniref:GGDEF domain-containing protein n=1 Tax=Vibrio makurazakiensis TaxID=2910250 RepID=UPI003D112748
ALNSSVLRTYVYQTHSHRQTNSILFTPIMLKDELLGVVTVQHHEAYKYKVYHRQLIEHFAKYIAIGLQNIRQQQILIEQQKQLQATNQRLSELAMTDPLTGLFNRSQLDPLCRKLVLERRPIGLLMIDIDFYKEYNDTYGHDRGDKVLKVISNLIKHTFPEPSAQSLRYGGDEFLILLSGFNTAELKQRAFLLQDRLHGYYIKHESSRVSDRVTFTVGVSFATEIPKVDENLVSTLVSHVDASLYKAKRHRRGSVAFNNMVIDSSDLQPCSELL